MPDSSVKVAIIGDAKSLQKAAAKAETAVGGLNKKLIGLGAGIGAVFVADKLVDFGNTAVKEADRVADAAGQIEAQLGPDLSRALLDRADDFSQLGQSKGDMLELEKRIIDIGTAAGATDQQLAPMAEELAAAAGAMTLIDTEGRDANYWIEQIGKAASTGSIRSLQELGVNLDEAAVQSRALADSGKDAVDQLTAEDYWGARVALIMEQLAPKVKETAEGTGDLEQKQAALNAKWETLTGEIGGPLTDLLEGVLDFVLRGVDGWQQLAGALDAANIGFGNAIGIIRGALGPIGLVTDAVQGLIDALSVAIGLWNAAPWNSGTPTNRPGSTGGSNSGGAKNVQVTVQGGSPEVIEQAVRNAIQHATGRGPLE